MDMEQLVRDIEHFSGEGLRGPGNLEEGFFVRSPRGDALYAPLSALNCGDGRELFSAGYVCESWSLASPPDFEGWFERHFGRKLTKSLAKKIFLLYIPNNDKIFAAVELLERAYGILLEERILLNRKNLPTQLGEWYAKTIFGLTQCRSTSQRGFDFFCEGERIEVKVEWGDVSSPKGVKIRKGLLERSARCIIVYLSDHLMIRDVCMMDSDFVLKKWSGKGSTVFLKDEDISRYFFSHSPKHLDKVQNPSTFLKYAAPTFAAKIFESFS